jgi:hypothetical protein
MNMRARRLLEERERKARQLWKVLKYLDRWDRAWKEAAKREREEFESLRGCFIHINRLEEEISDCQRRSAAKLQNDRAKKALSCKTKGSNVCEILRSHKEILIDDPDRLSTDFLKKLIGPGADNC